MNPLTRIEELLGRKLSISDHLQWHHVEDRRRSLCDAAGVNLKDAEALCPPIPESVSQQPIGPGQIRYQRVARTPADLPCVYRGELTTNTYACLCQNDTNSLPVYECEIHLQCVLQGTPDDRAIKNCLSCTARTNRPIGR